MSNRGILDSAAISRMSVTQNLQVPYGSQNHILKGIFFLNANIVLYNIVQNLSGLFFRSLTILILVIYEKVVYTNKEYKALTKKIFNKIWRYPFWEFKVIEKVTRSNN